MNILHSKIIGSGKNHVIILHGLLGMGDNWKSIANKLSSEGYCVHLIDQRNHGKSFHSNEMNYDLMVEDIYSYLNFHDVGSCILLGHSMGGKVAIKFSLLHSQYLKKLIIVDIAPKKYQPKFNYLFEALNTLDIENIKTRSEIKIALLDKIKEQSLVLFLLKNIGRNENNNFVFKANVNVLHQNLLTLMDKITIKENIFVHTTFIKGDKSDYINEIDAVLIKDKFPNSEIIPIVNSGHWVHAENPDYFYSKLIEILKK